MPCRKSAAATALVLLLAACGTPTNAPQPAEQGAAESESRSSPQVPLRGIVSASGAVITFRECGAPATRAVAVSDPHGEIAKAFGSLDAKLEDGVYVELDGAAATADGTRRF